MSKYSIEDTTLTAIADAIREKGGTTDPILAESMAAAIAAIEAGETGGEWNVTAGMITIAETQTLSTTEPWEIAHGLASKPLFALVCSDRILNTTDVLVWLHTRKGFFSQVIQKTDCPIPHHRPESTWQRM